MAGMFDDLVPNGTTPPPAAAGMFDDLMPKFGSDEYVAAISKKHGIAPADVKDIVEGQLSGSFVHGIPILGGLAQRAEPYMSAVGAGSGPYDQRVQQNKAMIDEMHADYLREHSKLNTGLEVGGGIASTLPLGMTALGARALGLTGTLPQMMGRSAVSNALISGTDAATREGGDIASATGLGGLIGGGAPVIGRAVGAAVSPVINTVRGILNPGEEAARRVASAVSRDVAAGSEGLNAQQFTAAQQAGAPVTMMERGGETTRALARSAANTSPEGRDILNRSINDRFETQGNRLTDYIDQTFHYPNAAAQQQALETTARATNSAAYQQAYQEGAGGVWSPELERLTGSKAVSDAMRRAATNAGDEAIVSGHGAMNPRVTFENGMVRFGRGPNGIPTYPDLQFWDLTRRELSSAANVAARAGDNAAASRLGNISRALNTELDRAVPSYQQARQGAAAAFGAENALEAGQNFATSRMANDEARQAIAQMSPAERRLFQDGYAARVKQVIAESGDRRAIMDQLAGSPAKRERMQIALGPDRARELQGVIHVERVMDLARTAVQGNSTTARQLAELGLAGGAYAIGSGGNVLNPDPQSIMNAALVYGAARGRHVIDARVAQRVAGLLTSTDPAQLAAGIRMLTQNRRLFGAIQNTDAALASIAARGAEPALTSNPPQLSTAQQRFLARVGQ